MFADEHSCVERFAVPPVMTSESVNQFMVALNREDGAAALTLMENGRVTIHSVYFLEVNGFQNSALVIFGAVELVREQVVLALIRLGANIDAIRDMGNGSVVTPAGATIFQSNVPALSLCFRLGANQAGVYRTNDLPAMLISGLQVALGSGNHAPLICLLDEVYTARPLRLNKGEVTALVALAIRGSPAKTFYEALESRGFEVKSLVEMKCKPSDEYPHATSMGDFLLSVAQKSGDAGRSSTLSREGFGPGFYG